MASNGVSKSAKIRGNLKHPVIDSDGHTIEFAPAFFDYLKEVAGPEIADRVVYKGEGGFTRTRFPWNSASPSERRDRRITRSPWWSWPTKNALDRATASMPRLLHERLDEAGIDFTVLYPTLGLAAPSMESQELRLATCRALNNFHADIFRDYADRITPAAAIPMHTPQEAIAELQHAIGELGLKVIMMAGHVRRRIPAAARKSPDEARGSFWLDTYGIDSEYDYDPVWAKCIELGVAPSFHSGSMGIGTRASISNYMYNHIGHFAAASEALCKSLFFGGVTRRFPALRFAFLEAGVGWGCNLYSDLIGHWEKRNHETIQNYNPANLDHTRLLELYRDYGGRMVEGKLEGLRESDWLQGTREDPETIDEWRLCGIERKEDIRKLFVPNFFFGCEADDHINAWAFDSKRNPMGARLNAIFSSDIGHWDVPDIREVGAEAYEMVEHGLISEDDFRDFVFTNPVKLWTGLNRGFFKGTVVEDDVDAFLAQHRSSGAEDVVQKESSK